MSRRPKGRRRHKVHQPCGRLPSVRLLVASVLLASTLALAGCGDGGGKETTDAPVQDIAMHGGLYEPGSVTVAKGTILRFEAHDTTHSARTQDGRYDAGDVAVGQHKDVTMDKAGTYVFQCRFHSGMRLTATVTAA